MGNRNKAGALIDESIMLLAPIPTDPELDAYVPEISKEEIRGMTALQPRDKKTYKDGTVDPTAAMRVVARRYGPVAMKVLAEIAQDIRQPGIARVKAAENLMFYGYGKPGLWVPPAETSGIQNTRIIVGFEQKTITVEESKPDPFTNQDDDAVSEIIE